MVRAIALEGNAYRYVFMNKEHWRAPILRFIKNLQIGNSVKVDLMAYSLWILVSRVCCHIFEVREILHEVDEFLNKDTIDFLVDWEHIHQVLDHVKSKLRRKRHREE